MQGPVTLPALGPHSSIGTGMGMLSPPRKLKKSASMGSIGTSITELRSAAKGGPPSPLADLAHGLQVTPKDKLLSRLQPRQGGKLYQAPFEVAYQQVAKARNLRKLMTLFYEADTDGSQSMSLSEFRDALRRPVFQRGFSALGVQPHQSEIVFTSMTGTKDEEAELTIEEFIIGLTELVGTNPDGTGKELDISMLRPTKEAKDKIDKMRKENAGASSELLRAPAPQATLGFDMGPVHLLPKVMIQQSFVHSVSAKALHSPIHSRGAGRRHSTP
mmetsp:Transcript_1957/g.4463  ORF Transcript_1957/g.4463 Transcript_1957/m.4463 type:complete len:273 (-) Transcript_1957:98-916(-)